MKLEYKPTLEEVEQFGKAGREIKETLQKRYKFSLVQQAFFLTCLIDELKEEIHKTWQKERKNPRR
jgi:hypothetical protein